MRWGLIGACVLTFLFALAPDSGASIGVARNASNAKLEVGRGGIAQVTWRTRSGVIRTAIVRRDGTVRWGKRIKGRDISRPAPDVRIPLAVSVRRTPDGRLWALQEWRRLRNGDLELHFSRWRGAPTKLTLRAVCCKWRSERLLGTASFQGRPVHGFSATRQGVPLDPFGRNVYVDALQGGSWRRIIGVLTKRPNGWYRIWVRPGWRGQRYRGTIRGPNFGWTLAPNARAETVSSL